ncbi:MAG: prephenate dehydrogenase/arogenate dehydrogenase family protein [Planctomycetaceae bacterium]|nr:prephenate dehydrogenase/arogenate dehydrogenase family protein [Planctomycetaceae bacterium]
MAKKHQKPKPAREASPASRARAARRPKPNEQRTRPAPLIGIVGIAGRYGQWLSRRFHELGYSVLGSDVLPGWLGLAELVQRADVVIFSVPMQQTIPTIQAACRFSRTNQLWLDITSLKADVMTAMLESQADVIGLHPLCGPDLPNWNGQTVAVCYGRLREPAWEDFVIGVLKSLKANYYVTDAVEHDRIMAYVQALPHALSMIMMGAFESLEEHGLSVSEIEHYATPPYRLAVAAMSRILAAHPDLYADIQILNRSHTLDVLQRVHEQAGRLLNEVSRGSRDQIVERLQRGRHQFKNRNIQSGMKGFLQMSRVMADLSSDNSKVIHTRRDQPGLLEKILGVFARHHVNLSGLHSFKTDEYEGFSFHFGLEGERDSLTLQKALCEMRNSPELRELIVIEDP